MNISVYNVEGDCKTQQQRLPACSMGLARDPRKAYEAANVVAHRVWHGDALTADCVLRDAERVGDETGVETTRWFRDAVPDIPEGLAWLPAVRTHDNPELPPCAS
ncbi:hypothetical protein ABT095_03850 [Kitasatospora sp. NPDC002227]|uniref:hypothetical protein n=1 Tax=Kitasatospora sp. NPDC002227 TaxID=3154773 RepID=UPI0033271396